MHLNKLRDIKKIKGESFKFSRIGASDYEENNDEDEPSSDRPEIHGFDID